MAPHTADATDNTYTVDIGTAKRISLSEIACSTFPGPPAPGLTPGSFVSRAFPISKTSPQIRVLDLQKSDYFDDPLVGSFRIVYLGQENKPHFTALSYVWGASELSPGTTIDLGVGRLPITRNCEDALRHIRQLYGDTTIWVDSICIDQTCESERGHQVSLMGDVYSRADKVYIWLGRDTPGIQRALKYIEFASTFMYLPLDRDACGGAFQRLKFQLKVLPPVVTLKLLHDEWKWKFLINSYRNTDFEELLNVAWFSRIWTFQEVVLATDAVILCGTTNLSWSVFARGLRCLNFLFEDDGRIAARSNTIDVDKNSLRSRFLGYSRGKTWAWDRLGNARCPRGFLALQRVLFLWMRIDRRGLRCNNGLVDATTGDSSILRHQMPYIDMCRFVRPAGAICTHIIVFMLLYGWFICREMLEGPVNETWFAIFIFSFLLNCYLLPYYLINFNAEGLRDLNMGSGSEQRVGDQLISAVVETLSHRQAKEPKDMAYALYGVLRGFGVDLSALDYSKPQVRIYHELCLDMLTFRSSAITLLMYVNKVQYGQTSLDTGTEESPTWVPDWSRLEAKQFVSLEPSSIPDYYCATNKEPPAFIHYSNDRRAIFVSAQWKEAIEFCMESLQAISDDPPLLTTNDVLYTAIKAFSGWVNTLKKAGFAKYEVHCCVGTCAGPFGEHLSHTCYCTPTYKARYPARVFSTFMMQMNSSRTEGAGFEKFQSMYEIFAQVSQEGGPEPHEMTLGAAQNILRAMREAHVLDAFVKSINRQAENNSRWFITSDGYLGCGTASVMRGDRLALVAGVPAPMVLRPLDSDKTNRVGTRYMAVCSAYVLGWMYGEVFEMGDMETIQIV